ncbi:M23 family metallopeptidase [Sporomusa malonica]|uniref:Murein DD-endopeptidase MepM and murein hydrolase activator NlpD, contain LysM domain n=1 Tax=Sporomusa malonica TaxID=112901 RepID=A0A1W1YRP3_9FIRM|nr:M23 family metallopeptidase [Sporomusa malonica]SMC38388.1 Murein DD-endopeptidase MepM and murein hydrolase activator NlpD, contain LysM domain [Sporomusa malonica]
MFGKILPKITRSSYLGQVLTAGVLLTAASLLMFAVISTFEPASKPPVVKTEQVSEPMQPAQTALVPQSHVNLAGNQEVPLITETKSPPAHRATAEHELETGNEAIRDLWSGTITHGFGWQLHPLYQDWRYHNGLDISGGEGQVVPALLSGEVVDVMTDTQYGLTVAVKSGRYTLYYGSLASVAVQKNTMINTGKPIGSMGISTSEPEPHLHLAVRANDGKQLVDPREIFPNMPN